MIVTTGIRFLPLSVGAGPRRTVPLAVHRKTMFPYLSTKRQQLLSSRPIKLRTPQLPQTRFYSDSLRNVSDTSTTAARFVQNDL